MLCVERHASGSFAERLRTFREASGYTQEELATIAGLSVHAVSALERGERRRPQVETVRALSAALDLTGEARDALHASARPGSPEAAVDSLSRGGLPKPLTAVLGRERDVEALQQRLGDPGVRLITLVGPGGVGKTRLALELARRIDEEGASRVVFVALAGIHEPALVAPAVAVALGLPDVAALELSRNVRIACGNRPTLLVVDNCEHLPDASALIGDLLRAAASLRVLATSRSPLHIRGERQYAVAPLAVQLDTADASLSESARAPAVQLFVERVRDVQPEFRVTPENGPVVTAICQRLDGLPLALELTARWMKVLTVQDLLQRLEENILLSTVVPRDLPLRQQTMNATVAWSYELLDPAERRAFRRFGVLPGRFAMEVGAAVLGGRDGVADDRDVLAAAASLVDKSLLQRIESAEGNRPFYQMLETVRAYARLQLSAAERDDVMEGLMRHCPNEGSPVADRRPALRPGHEVLYA